MAFQKENELPSAIILAAGKSERMGMPKFALKFKEQKTFLEEIVERFTDFGCPKIVVVMNKNGTDLIDKMKIKLSDNTFIILNPQPERGRFSSIKTGLRLLQNTNSIFLHNIDNPFVNKDILKLLFNNCNKADYCFPVHEKRGGHPILLTRKIINDIIKRKEDDLNLKHYLMAFRKLAIEVDNPDIYININTPEDHRKII